MKYCPECLEEYSEGTATCSECEGGVQLVTEQELQSKRPGFRRVGEEDETSFVRVATANDVYETDAFTSAIDEANIPVMARLKMAGTVSALTSGVRGPWWEILVPEASLAEAERVVEERRRALAEAEPDAEQAAEAEAEAESEPSPT